MQADYRCAVEARQCRKTEAYESSLFNIIYLKNLSDHALAILLDQPPGVQSLTAFFQLSPPALRIPKKEETVPSPKHLPESGTYITRNVDVVSQPLNLK
jgi:hypothetical protein